MSQVLGLLQPHGRPENPGFGLAQPQSLWPSGEQISRWKIPVFLSLPLLCNSAFQINKNLKKKKDFSLVVNIKLLPPSHHSKTSPVLIVVLLLAREEGQKGKL